MNAVVEEVRENVTEFRVPGPGERLRAARLALGLALADVASRLHLDDGTVEHLERDQYDLLPERVFVQGYVRNYARVVGLPPESVLKQLDEHCPVTEDRQFEHVGKDVSDELRSGGLFVRALTLFVALGTAALFIVWWNGSSTWLDNEVPQETSASFATDTPLAETDGILITPQQPAVTAGKIIPSSRGASETIPAIKPRQTETSLSSHALSVQSRERVLHATQATAPAATHADLTPVEAPVAKLDYRQTTAAPPVITGERQIVLEFSEPCWVDVRDSTRDFKLIGEMSKGARRVLGGTPPYKSVIGKASAVQVTVDGVVFDIKRYARGNVARFTLDPSKIN